MKIRNRIMTAFFIMTIVPIALMLACVGLILNRQSKIAAEIYSLNGPSYSHTDIILNPVDAFFNISNKDYETIRQVAQNDPDKFIDKDFLSASNKTLQKRGSFLAVTKNGEWHYIGDESRFETLSEFWTDGAPDGYSDQLTFIDQNTSCIIKRCTFQFSDQTDGQALLITNFSDFLSRWKHSIRDIAFAFFMILVATGILLSLWIYQSILRPLNILRLATMQIGAGNLNQPIHVSTSDEIGQLCRDFEEMRIRLKEMVNERVASEENIREIMSSISHDLKTPITAIKGYTEGILDGVADTPEKQQKYLQTIYSKANDIAYLIDELSLFSKVERNSLAYNFVSVNVDSYFTDCIEDVSLDLESKNMTIDYYNTTDKDTQILADPEQLKRVLHNIIENAVKYNDKPNGHISVRVENKVKHPVAPPLYRQIKKDGTDLIPRRAPDEFIQVQIEDNGPGIPAGDLPHIFDRFFRGDASRNSAKRGSGLGLAIVKVIISDHGGKVWAESIEGVGTNFYFTLKKV